MSSRNGARRRCRRPGAAGPARPAGRAARHGPAAARRHRTNLPAVAEEAQRLRLLADAPDTAPLGLSEELRALALINLGITEHWGRFAEGEPHLEQGTALARRIARPYLELIGLAHLTSVASVRASLSAVAEERARQTIDLARQHGWTDEPAVGIAYVIAKPDGALMAFLFHPPTRALFDRYAPDRSDQAALITEIRSLLPAEPGAGPRAHGATASPSMRAGVQGGRPPGITDSPRLVDPLSQSEIRVLRYLPTNLSAADIAHELSVSVTTVRTHIRHLFLKLGAHRRTEAVATARALGLLAPPPTHPENTTPT